MSLRTTWPVASLENLLESPLLNGHHQKGMEFGKGFRIVRMVDLYREPIIDERTLDRVVYPKPPKEEYALRSGDVLINRTSLKREGVAKAVLIKKISEPTYFDCSIIRVRPDTEVVDPTYFLRVLNSPVVRPQVMRVAKTATITTVSQPGIKSLQIPVPSLAEQKRIGRILDEADTLRAKRRESLAQLDMFLRSTFLDMFGDPVTNPMGWGVKPLGEMGTLDRGVSKHRPRNEPSLLGGSHPLIQTGEVANSEGYIRTYTSTYSDIGLMQSKMWPSGTLCITIAANIANTGILMFDACFPDSVVGFLSDKQGRVAYVQGLFWFFREILERRAPQSAQKNINLKILRGLPVPAPPADLQHSFARIVESVEQQKASQRAHLDELDILFASLQSRAFRGDLLPQ